MNNPLLMLVRKGHVTRCVDGSGKWWPVFDTREDAKRFAKLYNASASPAEFGSVEGETLEGHVLLAIEEGCVGTCKPMRWNDEGYPEMGTILFD